MPRSELWWECSGCGWVGCQRGEGERLVAMRRLEGDEGDCPFCGAEESTVASAPRRLEDTGGWVDWWVCLACGTSHLRHAGPRSG
ncbi:hypothetical protein [Streptomyces sp. MUM 203J]|uniref:hypothetical protein n=1 Tax=Streptomyces sp. MUM 203J TaxID=2791990 RepID=UPI001F0461C7|nr:hypothetical protein [Streptomyces sp. MUM 203J]